MPLAAQLSQRFLDTLANDHIPWSRRQLQPHFEKRLQIIRQLVGRHYGHNGSKERVPMNYVKMQTTILSRHLVSRSPRCMVEARDPRLRSLARATQHWAAELFDSMNLEKILLRWNIEAILYPIGLIKLSTGYGQAPDGEDDFLSPRIDNVDAERCVWDMKATRWDSLQYIGHRCAIRKNQMQGEGWDEDRAMKLIPEPANQLNEMGTDKTESIAQDGNYHGPELYDDIDCWEIYLPREGLNVVFPVIGNMIDARPVGVYPYVGPKTDENLGPFHKLGYDEVPGNLLPSPPVHAIFDLHEAINVIARKLLRQAQHQKTTTLVQQAVGDNEVKSIRDTPDMGFCKVTHPEAFNQLTWNGPNQANMAAMLTLRQQINAFGGNFEVLGGLGVQAPTATQEELLASSSSKLVQFMQQESLSRTRELMRAACWYDWHSRRELPYPMPVEGMGMSIPWAIQPEERYQNSESNFGRMQFSIHPYSMRAVTPEMRVAQWSKIFGEIIAPMAPMLLSQGATIDVMAFAKKIAEYMDLTDLDEVLKMIPVDPMASTQPDGPPGMQGAPRVRPPGTGQYTRTNVGTQEGQDQRILSMMDQGDAA